MESFILYAGDQPVLLGSGLHALPAVGTLGGTDEMQYKIQQPISEPRLKSC